MPGAGRSGGEGRPCRVEWLDGGRCGSSIRWFVSLIVPSGTPPHRKPLLAQGINGPVTAINSRKVISRCAEVSGVRILRAYAKITRTFLGLEWSILQAFPAQFPTLSLVAHDALRIPGYQGKNREESRISASMRASAVRYANLFRSLRMVTQASARKITGNFCAETGTDQADNRERKPRRIRPAAQYFISPSLADRRPPSRRRWSEAPSCRRCPPPAFRRHPGRSR